MHISEGILSPTVLAVGWAAAGAGIAIGIRKLDADSMARAGILSAAFFVASLIHVPMGFASVHLILNGLVGLLLGWAAFPAIFTALALQAVFFQFGGLTTLGVNTTLMALPAVVCHYAFKGAVRSQKPRLVIAGSFVCGFFAVGLAAIIFGAALAATGEAFFQAAVITVAAHVPVMVIEGLVTVFCIQFLLRVDPAMLSK
ncbi:MAG: cobalt transporter CbiM [Desulfatibacillaceae bacterium]|nr:cobalt transporter CbiM [Desulfatibacillaceae bacterium]